MIALFSQKHRTNRKQTMKVIKALIHFLVNTERFLFFLLKLCRQGKIRNPIKKIYKRTVAVLANGPSLKEPLPYFAEKKHSENIDYIVMNSFAFDGIFYIIKPGHYCLVDPTYFEENWTSALSSEEIDEIRKLFYILQNKVDWDLNLYIPQNYCETFFRYSGIDNKFINIIGINLLRYTGYEIFRNFFYGKGLAIPPVVNVSHLAIFIGINSGYNSILLYGLENDIFRIIHVDENNQVFYEGFKHFYEDKEKKFYTYYNSKPRRVSECFDSFYNVFKTHDILSKYADSMKVKIINCTRNSMVDSYKRLPLDIAVYDIDQIQEISL